MITAGTGQARATASRAGRGVGGTARSGGYDDLDLAGARHA